MNTRIAWNVNACRALIELNNNYLSCGFYLDASSLRKNSYINNKTVALINHDRIVDGYPRINKK